jgi:hypothetical protein
VSIYKLRYFIKEASKIVIYQHEWLSGLFLEDPLRKWVFTAFGDLFLHCNIMFNASFFIKNFEHFAHSVLPLNTHKTAVILVLLICGMLFAQQLNVT